MDEVAALQRTLRRCTAALVVAVGIATVALAASDVPGLLLLTGGGFYLVGSLLYVPRWSADDGHEEQPGETGT
jgi:hypothetical protein